MIHNDVERILFTEEQLRERVCELGRQIAGDHAGDHAAERLLVVGVLRGAVVFMADLVRAIELPIEMDFVAASSYGDAATSSGEVRMVKDLSASVEGRHVLIVEDVLDTGATLRLLSEQLAERNAASVQIAVLLRKQRASQDAIECRYVGFECPDEFVVGYGLDFAQRYRNLPYIGVLKPEVYK